MHTFSGPPAFHSRVVHSSPHLRGRSFPVGQSAVRWPPHGASGRRTSRPSARMGDRVLASKVERVQLSTELGVLHVELYPDRAPLSVANFLRYVDGGHYDGAVFYRVVRKDNQPQSAVAIEVIQGGVGPRAYDPTVVPAFPPVPHETTAASGLQHTDGVLSMARLDPGTATSEFFICVGAQPSLDFGGERNPDGQGFAAFGRVVAGMEVVRSIQGGAAGSATDVPPEMEVIHNQLLDEPVVIQHAIRML